MGARDRPTVCRETIVPISTSGLMTSNLSPIRTRRTSASMELLCSERIAPKERSPGFDGGVFRDITADRLANSLFGCAQHALQPNDVDFAAMRTLSRRPAARNP